MYPVTVKTRIVARSTRKYVRARHTASWPSQRLGLWPQEPNLLFRLVEPKGIETLDLRSRSSGNTGAPFSSLRHVETEAKYGALAGLAL